MSFMPLKLKKYYKKSFEIIRNNNRIIYFVSVIYFISLIIGIIYHSNTYKGFSSDDAKEGWYKFYKFAFLKDNYFDNFMIIFPHNIIASLFRIISGVLFAIFPIFNIIDGAISDSYILVSTTTDKNFHLLLIGWLPHSLIETPAFILSSSLGVMIFLSLFKPKNKIQNIIEAYKDSLIILIFIILPMLFFAAILESVIIVNLWF